MTRFETFHFSWGAEDEENSATEEGLASLFDNNSSTYFFSAFPVRRGKFAARNANGIYIVAEEVEQARQSLATSGCNYADRQDYRGGWCSLGGCHSARTDGTQFPSNYCKFQ